MTPSIFNSFDLIDWGIDTLDEYVIYLNAESEICRSEGFRALTQLSVFYKEKHIVATLHTVHSAFLKRNQACLSISALDSLQAKTGEQIRIEAMQPLKSLPMLRQKINGEALTPAHYFAIINDIVHHRYSTVQLSAFVTACAHCMTYPEIVALTNAMVRSGDILKWDSPIIVDKHCIGGLPGNRTTPIVVAIVAYAGLPIPKTSSRSITSPSGTADTLESITRVNLSMEEIQDVVRDYHGCMVWGGALNLSPADDIIIRVERVLDLDAEGQMIASILSKKIAAGCTHVLLDIPVGPDMKITTRHDAERLQHTFESITALFGLTCRTVITDGLQPVGFGIGPALEALDVLSVLKRAPDAPQDLRQKSLELAGVILEMGQAAKPGQGFAMANAILDDGHAYHHFEKICHAQGRFSVPQPAQHQWRFLSSKTGVLQQINCRKIAQIAKLSGAPLDKGAGILLHKKVGNPVTSGEALFTLYAETEGELSFASEFAMQQTPFFAIE